LSAQVERWPVAGAFVIARGAKTFVDVVVVEVSDGRHVGRGEGTPIYYHGETADTCAADLRGCTGCLDRQALRATMKPGAARNALDCALWDLEAQQAGVPLWQLAGMHKPKPLVSAFTISLGDPAAMEVDARARADLPLLKLKLAGEGDVARVAAVRRGAPRARLIVDANEAWDGGNVVAEARALAARGVEMIEQPVRAGNEASLRGVIGPVPWVADESCQTRAELDACTGAFQGINIKLDKAGGLTEALLLATEARERGLEIMVGCMLCTSLGITPAFLLAQQAKWVDLDGALLLAKDREAGFVMEGGVLSYS
jgi:L-Ala-D/L-Glu epimerase